MVKPQNDFRAFYQPDPNLTHANQSQSFPYENDPARSVCVFVCAPVWDLLVKHNFHMSKTEYGNNTVAGLYFSH